MRLLIAARSRFSEETLAACVARGVRQIVVLGAGLDMFSLRNAYAGVRVFEVDYPATQDWKRERLKQAGLAIPASLLSPPSTSQRQSLADGTGSRGPFAAIVRRSSNGSAWCHTLTREAISVTLDFIAGVPDSEVVFDLCRAVSKIILTNGVRVRRRLPSGRPRAASHGSACSIRPNSPGCCTPRVLT